MKYIKFKEATAAIKLPEPIGSIPFVVIEGNQAAVACVRLTEQDLHAIRQNNYRMFLVLPTVPPDFDRPAVVTLLTKDPFAKVITSNGDEKEG